VFVDGTVQVTHKGRRVATLSNGDFVSEIALLTDGLASLMEFALIGR